MSMEVMVLALWVAALFLILWQIIISVQFSRMSSDISVKEMDIEEGWNYADLEQFCRTIAGSMLAETNTEDTYDTFPVDSQEIGEDDYAHTVGQYLDTLENRIDTLETLLEHHQNELANMSAGHLSPHMTQYGHRLTDSHYVRPVEVHGNSWAEPVRLRRV